MAYPEEVVLPFWHMPGTDHMGGPGQSRHVTGGNLQEMPLNRGTHAHYGSDRGNKL